MDNKKINISKKFEKFSEHWSPKIIAELNDYQFKVAKIKGYFVWHKHKETDEVFIVIKGKMQLEFREETIKFNEGEMYVVPKGKDHRPFADEECCIMLIEPRGVVNTGEVINDLTRDNDVWI